MEVVENCITESVTEASFGNHAQIEYVPYGRLCRSPLNVRKKAPTGIEALAETIVVKCILQNLVVHEVTGRSKQPKLGVCAGQRRLAALDLLFSPGADYEGLSGAGAEVSEGEAVAASLIENREREAMSIADESVAFRLLTEEGKSVAHIAVLFKVSEMVVRRALKIANLAPTLLDLLRDDTMDYEQAKVLALADDHATQERVWNDAHNAWQRRPSELRAAITKAEIDARDSALAKFVGLDAYEAAGGFVRRDLFSDGEHAGYIADADLLHRLATDRLIEVSQTVQSEEGWSWVETRTRGDANELIRYGRLHSTTRKPTKSEKAELAALVATRDAAHMELNAYYDEDGEEDEARHDHLSTAVDVATHAVDQYAARFEVFGPEDMQRAGAFVYVDDDGFVTIERGLIRPEERAAARGDDALPVTATGQSGKPARVTPVHHEKLCRRLTAHRTAAIQTELARHPNVALAVLMSRMIPVVFEEHYERQYPEHAIEVEPAHIARCTGETRRRHGRQRGVEGDRGRAREVDAHASGARGCTAAVAARSGFRYPVEPVCALRGGHRRWYRWIRPRTRRQQPCRRAERGSVELLEAHTRELLRPRVEIAHRGRAARARITAGRRRGARHEEGRGGGCRRSADGRVGLATRSACEPRGAGIPVVCMGG